MGRKMKKVKVKIPSMGVYGGKFLKSFVTANVGLGKDAIKKTLIK